MKQKIIYIVQILEKLDGLKKQIIFLFFSYKYFLFKENYIRYVKVLLNPLNNEDFM